jgi:hypothetical protein
LSPSQIEQIDKQKIAAWLPRELRLGLIVCAVTIAIGTIGACAFEIVYVPTLAEPHFVWLTALFFQTQDLFWLAAIAVLLAVFAITPLPIMPLRAMEFILRRPHAALICLAGCVFVVGVVGTHIVFDFYHLSRDEFLSEFDAIIFRSGKVIAPIEVGWQPFASALAPRFMLPIADGAGFASSYLPINAVLRTIVGLIADSSWTSPLLAACAVVATFGVARRLWPTRPDVAFISVLLVATSSQVIVTSMTSYAMTAHLALNMIWLWFFLRNDKIGHAAAIATGFLASGLHQLIFHPLFVVPFVVRLWLSGRRSLALVYIASYAAICLFWISYWEIILAWQGISPQVSDDAGPLSFLVRTLVLVENFRWAGADLMLKNVLRFVAWQSPALLPLAFLAYPAARSGSGIARELIAGLLLTLVAMFILLPYQGNGWGYRYLHGLIGSLALLGGYGWVALSKRATQDQIGASRTMLAVCTAFAWFVLLPVHAKQAHDFARPYVRASKAIEQASTDVVIIDKSRLLFAEDLVRNDPFLRNRPKVLDLTYLTDADIERLCTHYSISLFDHGQALALGIAHNDQATEFRDDVRAKLRAALSRRACGAGLVVKAEGEEQSRK